MKNAVGYKKFFIQAFIKLLLSRTMPPMFSAERLHQYMPLMAMLYIRRDVRFSIIAISLLFFKRNTRRIFTMAKK